LPIKCKAIFSKGKIENFTLINHKKKTHLLFRFLDKLYDFFKPEQKDGFNTLLLTDSLSNVTCRSLLALSDLLVYPHKSSSNQIKVFPIEIKITFSIQFSISSSQVISFEHFCQRSTVLWKKYRYRNSFVFLLSDWLKFVCRRLSRWEKDLAKRLLVIIVY